MSQHKKKPVQYFFVDINDPDYYKRIKVARACTDCRKRKSKCDIGKPGSGACSSCRKHNKICEFTATTTAILSSSLPTISSSPSTSVSSAQPHIKKKKVQRQQQDQLLASTVVSEKIVPTNSFQAETGFHWPPHQLTLIPFMVPESTNYYKNNDNHHPNTTTNDASQFAVTQEDNHLVGHLRFNLPVRCEQRQPQEQENLPTEITFLPTIPPLLLSSHSLALFSSSSSSTTPSPPVNTNHACDATFPWKTSKSGEVHPKKENFMRSVSHVDPVKDECLFSSLSPSPSPSPPSTITTTTTSLSCLQQLLLPSEIDLIKLYFDRIHPSYPALPKNILERRHDAPICIRYSIMALSLLYYHRQTTPIPTQIINLAYDYYNKAWAMIQSRGTSDLVSAQTLLLLYKYHETIGQVKTSLLESTRAILERQQQQIASSFGGDDDDDDDDDDDKEEWICRLYWLVYLHQFNTPATDTALTSWKGLPMIRLPCLLPSEQQDDEQAKVISQFLDSIHIACVYSSAMQNIVIDDPWSSSPAFGQPHPDNDIDSSIL